MFRLGTSGAYFVAIGGCRVKGSCTFESYDCVISPEILALIEKPHLLIAVLFAGALIGMTVEQIVSRAQRSPTGAKHQSPQGERPDGKRMVKGPWLPATDPWSNKSRDAADQLRIVMAAEFTIQPLLNRSEARVFRELESFVTGGNPTWQVMAQVSLGEILRSDDADAFGCINSKRVDLLLIDPDCRPRLAIECQGGAHYQKDAAARDAVKKEALRRAGISYYEVVAGRTTPSDLKRMVEKLVAVVETSE